MAPFLDAACAGSFGAYAGPSYAILGLSWNILGPSWCHLGPSWAILVSSCGHAGAILVLRFILGLGAFGGSFLFDDSCAGSLGVVLGHLGAVLAPSWGRLGAVLGHPGVSWGHLGAVLG